MINGLYVYFDTNRQNKYANLVDLNVAGSWDSTFPYSAAASQAALYGNATYLAIRDNTNVVPTASTNSTSPSKWSPLILVSTVTPTPGVDDIAISGNTIGVSQSVFGEFILAGGANITLSQLSNTVSIGGAGGGVVVSAGINTQSTGTVIFSDFNGISFGLNTNGALTASYTVPATVGLISAIKVLAGTLSNNLSAFTFSNSNGVSFGLGTDSVITATVATNYQSQGVYLTTAMQSNATTISNVNVSAGTTSNNVSAFTFSNGSGVLFGYDGTNITASVKTDYQTSGAYLTTAMASNAATISNIKISGGALSNNLSALTFSDSNGISFGLNTNSVLTATVATNYQSQGAYLTTAMQSNAVTISNVKMSAGTLSNNLSALTFADSNGITFGLNTNSVITAAVATNYQSQGEYLTTAMQSQSSSVFAKTGFTSTTTAGTAIVGTHNTDGLSLGVPAFLTTAMQSNAATISNINVSVGTTSTNASAFTFSNSNGVSFGLGTGGSAGVITATVQTNYLTTAALSSQTLQFTLGGNVATTNSSQILNGGFILAGGNSLTIQQSNNSISFSVGNYLTTAMQSQSSSVFAKTGFTSTTTAGTAIVGTHNTDGLSLGVPAFLTTAMQSNAATISNVNIFAGTTSTNASAFTFNNSNGVSFGLGTGASAGIVTATVATNYQSQGAYLTTASTFKEGVTDSGNSAGTIGFVDQNMVWVATGGVSLSQSQDAASHSGTITISVAVPTVGWFEPVGMTNTALFGPVAGSWYFAPFVAPQLMSGGRINFLQQNPPLISIFQDITGAAYVSSSTGTLLQSFTYSKAVALYSQGAGTNSTRLESLWSNSFSWGWSKDIRVSTNAATNIAVTIAHSLSYISEIGSNGAYTLNQFASAISSTVANSSTSSAQFTNAGSSIRNMISNSVVEPIGFNTTIQPGAYWLAFAWSTTRATASTGALLASALDFQFSSQLGISRLTLELAYRNWGSTTLTNRSHIMPYGVFTGAANMAPPSTLAFSSDLSSLASAWVPYFNFQNQGITK